jgi:cob(I)alamin adenosyltransferase
MQGMVSQLEQIQCLLQDVGSNIATPRDSATAPRLARTEFDSDGQHVQDLETWIDAMDQELPPLTSFILPVSVACLNTRSTFVAKHMDDRSKSLSIALS